MLVAERMGVGKVGRGMKKGITFLIGSSFNLIQSAKLLGTIMNM
jgi:hypothetical protein